MLRNSCRSAPTTDNSASLSCEGRKPQPARGLFIYTGATINYLHMTMTHFRLYSRSYCHLCDDMLEALQSLSGEYPFTIEVVDVDTDDALVAQYDELVPVLVGGKDGGAMTELCNYFLDEPKVRAFLAGP
jgi:thiol-disulfide isomerase/thioredoxin